MDAASSAGDTILFSDLVAMGFDPVERAAHYGLTSGGFDPLKAQESHSPPADVASELDKLNAADRIILHFPIWWFGPPAVLKGWCERVLMHGHTHDTGHRFDAGRYRGKHVLFCVTTGSKASESGPDGREGNIDMLLWPLAMTFRYLGFDVLKPEIAHGVHGYHRGDRKVELETRLAAVLADQSRLIAGLSQRDVIPFNADTDFDEDGRLDADAPSLTPFIRR